MWNWSNILSEQQTQKRLLQMVIYILRGQKEYNNTYSPQYDGQFIFQHLHEQAEKPIITPMGLELMCQDS